MSTIAEQTTVVIEGEAGEGGERVELARVDVHDVELWLARFASILRPYFAERGITTFHAITIAGNGDRQERTL